jgi:hypothetical protein
VIHESTIHDANTSGMYELGKSTVTCSSRAASHRVRQKGEESQEGLQSLQKKAFNQEVQLLAC